MIFEYGEKELNYLKSKDKKLARVIEQLGFIERECFEDIFEAIINCIVGQQISTKAHKTIWNRMLNKYETITADKLYNTNDDDLQSLGLTYRKVNYIKSFAKKVLDKEIDLDGLKDKTDEEIIEILTSLDGIGVWTAEMLMLHALQRKDILSYKDLGIINGMKMVYHHKDIDKKRFERYRKRFSPYGSIASIYFWEVSSKKRDIEL